jgi:hypothetical protein
LDEIEKMIINNNLGEISAQKGKVIQKNLMNDFINSLQKFYDVKRLNHIKL